MGLLPFPFPIQIEQLEKVTMVFQRCLGIDLTDKTFHLLYYRKPPLSATMEKEYDTLATFDDARQTLVLTGSTSERVKQAEKTIRQLVVLPPFWNPCE